ncbi:hypothetical protein GCM10009775_03070 [Microbacterium aoyamense]|uniref:FtsX extracellular domain-containing protein n=1 Tax=Microbacterium aoyamense TaxID=344166 RepID=A0ABN2P9R5_9MICO|nr:hypothetical protein [Microbacterium aoyamense]
MTPDQLDDLLDRSSPTTRAPRDADITAMIADARAEAPRPRKRRIAIGAGVLTAVLIGGAGVAVAADRFSWWPWAQDPVGAVSFTMPNGFECELRLSEYSGGGDPAFLADVNRALEEWYASTDVVALAEARLPQKRADYAAMTSAQDSELEAQLAELTPAERDEAIAHNAWAAEWTAWDLVVSDLETEALRDAGFPVPDERFAGSERVSGIQCLDLDGQPYAPGGGR